MDNASKDVITSIFDYLEGKDLIYVATINKRFYEIFRLYISQIGQDLRVFRNPFLAETKTLYKSMLTSAAKFDADHFIYFVSRVLKTMPGICANKSFIFEPIAEIACYHKSLHSIEALTRNDLDWDRLLSIVSKCEHVEAINLIVDLGTRIGHDFDWNYGFVSASANGRSEVLDLLLENGINKEFKFKWNEGLYCSCMSGCVNTINRVISAGIENRHRFNWNDGLFGACDGGHHEVASMMIRYGADDFDQAVMCAYKKGDERVIELLSNNLLSNYNPILYYACKTNNIALANRMINNGAKGLDKGLYYACQHNATDVLKILIIHGAKICNYCHGKKHFM